ncbi:MAG: hypothetical protein KME25_12330 [Symplocastrum torsivum CPER-KK1]|jgi:hypothetical protein|uniref:Uncharacterized protein n=1 Tax=Symplocastrum torsivum CPER-KK1 TaxID=450513 RepID=A0A951U9W1_9CYAN|nr:hypothetical protein [Symplocastrum torsivum CPER-KK1]
MMIYYKIEPLTQGYRLSIWEPAPRNRNRVEPFYFKLNFTTKTLLEAMKILNLIPGKKIDERRLKAIKPSA